MSFFSSQPYKVFAEGLWRNNPIFVMVLGICSSLAVTTIVKNAFVMYLGVLFATVLTSVTISSIRKMIPGSYRMLVFMMVTSTLVIVFDRVLKVALPSVSQEMGPYVGLIITNCIVMGRAEAYAISNPPLLAAMDAAGACTGYGIVLILIALIRESLGMGTLFGVAIMPAAYEKCGLVISAPGAFLCLASLLLIANTVRDHFSGGGKQ